MPLPPWKRRFLAPRVSLPIWARDEPERLVYGSNAGGKWEVYAWDRRDDTHRQVTDRPEGTRFGMLDPAGERVWWLDDKDGNEFGRFACQPFAGGETQVVAPELPPAYPAGLALARSFAVLGSSTDDGSAIHLLRDGEPPARLYQHREDADVAALSRDETLLSMTHSEHGDSRHPAGRVLALDGSPVAELWDGPGRGLHPARWSPVVGDQRLLVTHERSDLPRPLIWSPEADDAAELDIDLPGEVFADWYPDASALLIWHGRRGRSELYRLDLATNAPTKLETEPGTVGGAVVRPDGEVWYAWASSSTPPEVRANDRVLLRPAGERAPGGVAYSEHDVEGVPVFLAEPEGPRPHPTVFEVHGGPAAHDQDAFSPFVQAWVDHGYAVLLVNYRGSTGYGKAWRDGLEGNPGFTELEDIAKVHDWVVREAIADPRRVVLSGASWGGYLTLLGLGTQPERWSLGIAGVPVADYVAAFEDEMEPLKAFDRALFGGSPDDKPEFYRERSPITHVERVRVPVMVLAGENDPRCPIRQIDNYLARLRDLGKPHEVYRFDAGHSSLVIEETIRQVEAQLAFASKHLGTTAPE
ncbi:MAG: prolyl oligopeptidase family serine peptidase [Dehalococcoidia bacterium]